MSDASWCPKHLRTIGALVPCSLCEEERKGPKRYRVSYSHGIVEDTGQIFPVNASQPMVRAVDYDALLAAVSALEKEVAGLREDAERYRFLRDHKCNSLHLTRDGDHACNYVTAKEWIEEFQPDWFVDDPPDEVQKMKDTNTIWTLQIYPRTPIGFDAWNRSTLDAAVEAAIDAQLAAMRTGEGA